MKNKKRYYYYDDEQQVGLSGVRPARSHQRVARNILYNLLIKISLRKYEPIMEANMEDEDTKSKSPDLMIINRKSGNIEIVFEICRTKQVRLNLDKIIELFDAFDGIKEAFVYDYEVEKWYKMTPKREYKNLCYFSDVLEKDMSEYVNFVRRDVKL